MAKQILAFSPVFNPTAKTLDFTGYSGFSVANLYAVTDTTHSQLIYATATPGFGYISVTGSVITLQYNTTSLSSSDTLQVLYEVTTPTVSTTSTGTIGSPIPSLATFVAVQDPSGNLASLQLDAFGQLKTSASFTGTLSENIAQFGGNNVQVGTGLSGAGIPRMTVSSDSSMASIGSIINPVTVNAGTNLNTSALALESGGNLAGINTKLTTTANGLKVDNSGVTQPITGTVISKLEDGSGNSLGSVANALFSSSVGLATLTDNASSTQVYIGKAIPGTPTSSASWSIALLTTNLSNGNITMQWAGGSNSFTNVWNNRTALTYS